MKSYLLGAVFAKCVGGILTILLTTHANAAPVIEIEPNDSIATAQNRDGAFSLDFDINIENDAGINTSTTIPHAEVQGTGNLYPVGYRYRAHRNI